MALRRETVAYEGQHFTLPLPDGPGKALRLTVHPVRDRHPDLPRRGRPEEPRARRRDRRRLAGDLLQPRARRRPARLGSRAGAAAAGRGTPERPAGRLRRRRRRVPVVLGDDVAAARRPAAPLRRAVRRRHGQPGAELLQRRWPCGWASSEAAAAGPGPLPRPPAPGRRRRGAARVHRPDRLIGPRGADPGPARALRRGRRHHPSRRPVRAGPGASDSRVAAHAWPRLLDEPGWGAGDSERRRSSYLRRRPPRRSSRGSPSSCRSPPPVTSPSPRSCSACRSTTRRSRRSPPSSSSARSSRRCIYFRKDIVRLARRPGSRGLRSAPRRASDPDYRLAWAVIVGSIPVGVVGLLAKDLITGAAAQPVGRGGRR